MLTVPCVTESFRSRTSSIDAMQWLTRNWCNELQCKNQNLSSTFWLAVKIPGMCIYGIFVRKVWLLSFRFVNDIITRPFILFAIGAQCCTYGECSRFEGSNRLTAGNCKRVWAFRTKILDDLLCILRTLTCCESADKTCPDVPCTQ